MQGNILKYDVKESKGIISANNGERYEFNSEDWESKKIFPKLGMKVDFVFNENKVTNIYSLEKENNNIIVNSKETPASAILSLIFGLIGFTFGWWFLAIPSIIAVIMGHISKSKINNNKDKYTGAGLATAGLILGYLVIIVYLLLITVFVGIFAELNQ